MDKMRLLKNKIALITGAVQGVGKGIAAVLAEYGADIVLNDIVEPNNLAELKDEIGKWGTQIHFVAADVTNETEVVNMFAYIIAQFGRLDVLINNAGTSQAKDIFEQDLEDWNRIINTNLTSVFLCSKEAMKIMRGQQSGRIINISSVVAQQGALMGHVHYAASKSGILGITKTLARTGAPLGINVNAIAPGIIETELLTATHGEEGIKKIQSLVPLGLGSTRAVGLAAAFLAGEGGDYITGTTIDVNGGLYIR